MSVIRWILTIAIIAVSIVMTVVILMQEGRSQGLGTEAECVIICTPAIFCRSVFLCAKQ